MSTKITRRKFNTLALPGIGADAVSCAGLGKIASRQPIKRDYYNKTSIQNLEDPTVLVTYGSKAGSTAEISQAIANVLERRNFCVDLSPVNRITDLKSYKYVVIGSAIRMGSPLQEVIEFVEKNSDILNTIPTYFFAVHLRNIDNNESSNWARLAYLDPIRRLITLQQEAFFTGVHDPKKVSFMEAKMLKVFKSPVGDFRDWGVIMDWGQSIFSVMPTTMVKTKVPIL